jgi:hypothetical protein
MFSSFTPENILLILAQGLSVRKETLGALRRMLAKERHRDAVSLTNYVIYDTYSMQMSACYQ